MNMNSKVASILGISDDGISKAHTDYAKMHLEETGAEFLLGFIITFFLTLTRHQKALNVHSEPF
jgi:hypothetical protein